MKTGTIIIYFADRWDDSCRRRQQIALRLVKLPEVEKLYYIELPLSGTSFIKYLVNRADKESTQRWSRVLKSGFTFDCERITIITPFSLFPFFTFWGQNKFNELFMLYYIKLLTGYYNLVWHSIPFWTGALKEKDVNAVYDRTENFIEFKGWAGIKKYISANDLFLREKADIVIVQIENDIDMAHKEKTFVVPNGCEYAKYVDNKSDGTYVNIRKPIIGFVGNINKRSNWALFNEITNKRPDWSFILIGNISDKNIIMFRDNVYLIGEVPYKDLSMYIEGFDVCLLLYNNIAELGSPQKLFDYLSSGKPVVSTSIEGVKRYSDLIYIAENADDFIDKIEHALSEEDTEKAIKRKEMAKGCSWDERFKTIYGVLKEKCLL